MMRGELQRALERGALPVPAQRSLRRLLEEEALRPYVRIAESGALRIRRVGGGFPPTSEATNEIRRNDLGSDISSRICLAAWSSARSGRR